jgi:hypothetical protein
MAELADAPDIPALEKEELCPARGVGLSAKQVCSGQKPVNTFFTGL